jgi:hypothetical protein
MGLGSEIKYSGLGIWEKNLFRIPDPGIKKALDPGSRIQGSKRHWIPDPDLQHCSATEREERQRDRRGGTVPVAIRTK